MICSVWWLLIILTVCTASNNNDYETSNLELLLKSRTTNLRDYSQYSNVVIIHIVVPTDVSFVSFNFVGSEVDFSIFGCDPRSVDLYLKHGALPVVNPDGTKFPNDFKNITRNKIYHLKFKTDEKNNYVNITAPEPGPYYAITFLSYSKHHDAQIKQEGLGQTCSAFVDAAVYVKKLNASNIIVQNNEYQLSTPSEEATVYKTYIPENIDYALLTLNNITFGSSTGLLVISIQARGLPSTNPEVNIKNIAISNSNRSDPMTFRFLVEESNWHYMDFKFTNVTLMQNNNNSLSFSLKLFSTKLVTYENDTHYKNAITRWYLPDSLQYKQYNLVRGSISESFAFSYQLEEELDNSTPLPINLTNTGFTTLKFLVRENTDMGGTLQFILAFKPRITRIGKSLKREEEPPGNTIIACIRKDVKEIPTRPGKCLYGGKESQEAVIVLNKTVTNDSLMIPFPESGVWYVTFRLYCGENCTCDCSTGCRKFYASCTEICTNEITCVSDCKRQLIARPDCTKCDCVDGCKSCNSSIVFDVSSNSCINGYCGKNGNCILMVSDSVVYSTCRCTNRYRGWDCKDDSLANPMWEVLLELLLLVLSNLSFLPSVYIAYKRQYYLEAVCYFLICFFSTFYHACDAGENLINYCIARLPALQFADFLCALNAIWVTLIAIADFRNVWTNVFQIAGTTLLAFFTTVNMHALWTFAVPCGVGLGLICISWYLKYKKIKQCFVDKYYLCLYIPVGVVVVTIGLIIYALLQTESNYKYLHSLWHVMMAMAVIILLPRPNTFQPHSLL